MNSLMKCAWEEYNCSTRTAELDGMFVLGIWWGGKVWAGGEVAVAKEMWGVSDDLSIHQAAGVEEFEEGYSNISNERFICL